MAPKLIIKLKAPKAHNRIAKSVTKIAPKVVGSKKKFHRVREKREVRDGE